MNKNKPGKNGAMANALQAAGLVKKKAKRQEPVEHWRRHGEFMAKDDLRLFSSIIGPCPTVEHQRDVAIALGWITPSAVHKAYYKSLRAISTRSGLTIDLTTGKEPDKEGYAVNVGTVEGARHSLTVVDTSLHVLPTKYSTAQWTEAMSRVAMTLWNFIHNYALVLSEPGHYLGVWYDKKTSFVHYDVVMIAETAEVAEQICRELKEIAYYDLANDKEARICFE